MSELASTSIGHLSADWQVKRLGDVSDKIQDGTHFSPQSTTGPFRYITSRNIRFGRMDLADCDWISEEEHRSIYSRCDVKRGDVLLTKDGANTGNAALNTLNEEFSLLSSVALIRCNEIDSHSPFVLQYLLSPIGQQRIKDLMAGNAITRLTLEKIRNFQVPIPAISHQRKIARILTTLDNLIEKTEALIAKYQAIKQGMMHDLFTRGVNTSGQLRPTQEQAPDLYKQSELGWIPKVWEVDPIGSRCEVRSAGTPSRSQLERYFVEGTIPWVKTLDLNEDVIVETDERITEYALKESSCSIVPKDTVLIAMYGGYLQIGRTAILGGPSATNQAISSLQTDDSLVARYLLRYMQFSRFRWRQFAMSTRKDPNITKSDILKFLLAIPSIEEQAVLTERIDSIQKAIYAEEKHLDVLSQTKSGLMQDLLTGKVRVKVDEAEEVAAHA